MTTNNNRLGHWQKTIIQFFWPFAKSDKLILVLLGSISLVMVASNTLLIWMIGQAITQITDGLFEFLNQTLLIIAAIVLFNLAIQLLYSYQFQRATLRFVDRVRSALLGQVMLLSYPIRNRYEKGDLLTRLSSDVDRVSTYIFNVPLNLVANSVVLTVYTSMIFWINWELALIALTMAPLFFLSQRVAGPHTGRASRNFTVEKANLMSIEEQALANLRGISSFNSERTIRKTHQKQFELARNWALKVRMIRLLYNSVFTVLLYIVALVVIYSGISSIQAGELPLGVFVSFLVYIRFLTNPVRSLARMPIQMQANRAPAERVMEVLQLQADVQESEASQTLNITEGKIEFDHVNFSYNDDTSPVFSNVTQMINAGETVALVGPSGSGKSTFAGLLLRFYDPQSGSIKIDGINIKDVTLKSLRDQISIVWQEPFIVTGTIKDNLQLARPGATLEQMIESCKSSYAWEFIDKLDQGLDTTIGVNGISLSVGQTQRIAIAQAFLRDSPILVLDEASSALDSHSEKLVVDALQTLRQNRTTLVIAHRFSSIRTANRILYFEGNGKITADSHEALMKSNVHYKKAVDWQISLS